MEFDTALTRALTKAWQWRNSIGCFYESDAFRIFHGPGEGNSAYRNFAIDKFGDHYWITYWEEATSGSQAVPSKQELKQTLEGMVHFLKSKGAVSVVLLHRPLKAVPEAPKAIFGTPPEEKFRVQEGGCYYWVQTQGVRHPGLFLDHAPLRRWLKHSMRKKSVLNTFAYTGSLSIAAGLGGAASVTTLDLSQTTVDWAKANWKLNYLPEEAGHFQAGDVFQWLPRYKRQGKLFDCVILDPPSFSRSKGGEFSTSKDLVRLHELALDLLSPNGVLVTSINSSNVTWKKFQADVEMAAQNKRAKLQVIQPLGLPDSFPTRLGMDADQYLKGWILRRS